jgi:DNA primase small subunit
MPEEPPKEELKKREFQADLLKDLLPIYYKRLFPHKLFYRWMSYGLCKLNSSS